MVPGTHTATHSSVLAWAQDASRRNAERAAAGLPAVVMPEPTRPQASAPAPTVGTGYDRAVLDGVTIERPLDIVPTALTNMVERVSGTRDERSGRSLMQVALAGQQLVQAGLLHAAQGTGVVAAGSSILGKVLPTLSIASGAAQVWKGWNELDSHEGGPLALLGSRTARTGLLTILAGGLLFVPGVGSALAGAGARLVAAANEVDAFSSLDTPPRAQETP